jgi:hypothetical protein
LGVGGITVSVGAGEVAEQSFAEHMSELICRNHDEPSVKIGKNSSQQPKKQTQQVTDYANTEKSKTLELSELAKMPDNERWYLIHEKARQCGDILSAIVDGTGVQEVSEVAEVAGVAEAQEVLEVTEVTGGEVGTGGEVEAVVSSEVFVPSVEQSETVTVESADTDEKTPTNNTEKVTTTVTQQQYARTEVNGDDNYTEVTANPNAEYVIEAAAMMSSTENPSAKESETLIVPTVQSTATESVEPVKLVKGDEAIKGDVEVKSGEGGNYVESVKFVKGDAVGEKIELVKSDENSESVKGGVKLESIKAEKVENGEMSVDTQPVQVNLVSETALESEQQAKIEPVQAVVYETQPLMNLVHETTATVTPVTDNPTQTVQGVQVPQAEQVAQVATAPAEQVVQVVTAQVQGTFEVVSSSQSQAVSSEVNVVVPSSVTNPQTVLHETHNNDKSGIAVPKVEAADSLQAVDKGVVPVTEKAAVATVVGTKSTESFSGVADKSPEIAKTYGTLTETSTVSESNTAVYKTAAAQVGEAIVQYLTTTSVPADKAPVTPNAAKKSNVFNTPETPLNAETSSSSAVTARQVVQAVKSGQAGQTQQSVNMNAGIAVNKSPKIAPNGISEFKVTLKPVHLGEVVVRLAIDGANKMSVVITAASEVARDLLMSRANSIRVMVEVTGIVVDKYEVVVVADNVKASYLDPQEHEQREKTPEQRETESEPETSDDGLTFAEVVEMIGV